MPQEQLDLRFGPGPSTGFTPAGIAAFKDLRPAAVVRELLQNSLDARSPNQQTARVCFRLSREERSKIPGLQSYGEALEAAVKTQAERGGGALPSQANQVAATMMKALSSSSHEVLTVFDNGIGLNEQRMNALLSDGVSAKESSATGTYGNGHCVAIPASDLRYVLYAGLTEDGGTIASGHAVIASHALRQKRLPRGGDGFLVKGFRNGLGGKLYDYESGENIPALLRASIDELRNLFGHGTAVVLPAFNNFRERKTLWEMVSRAAACNFFAAIDAGRLVVEVQDARGAKTLNRSNLRPTLARFRGEKRSRAFLSGGKAWDALQALQEGASHVVKTDEGSVHVRLLQRTSGIPRVDLCRNGMWVVNDKKLPGFYYQFNDKEPFRAVLLLEAEEGGELHRLIREAEGPLHNQVDFKDLSREDRRRAKGALGEIREWLRRQVPDVSNEEFGADDFLVLEDDGAASGTAGWTQQSFWGTPTAVERRMPARVPLIRRRRVLPPEVDPPPPPPPPPPRKRRRRSLQSLFQAVSVPTGVGRSLIEVHCEQEYSNAELRLYLDENLDATCDRVPYNELLFAVLSSTTLNGHPAPPEALVCNDGGDVVGVRLGDLVPDEGVCVETDWSFPGRAGGPDDQVSLRVQVSKADSLGESDEDA